MDTTKPASAKTTTTKPSTTRPVRPTRRRVPLRFVLCECVDESPVPEDGGPWHITADSSCAECGGSGVTGAPPGAGHALRVIYSPCKCFGDAPCSQCEYTGALVTTMEVVHPDRENERAVGFLRSLAASLPEAPDDARGEIARAAIAYLDDVRFYGGDEGADAPLFATAGSVLAVVAAHSDAGREDLARAAAEGFRSVVCAMASITAGGGRA